MRGPIPVCAARGLWRARGRDLWRAAVPGLVTLAALLGPTPVPVPALARTNVAPSVNCAALTLTLKPGLRLGSLRLNPAPDIPPGPVVMSVPVYPTAISSHAPFHKPFVQYPDSHYLKTATAELSSPADIDTLDQWYRQAFDACGYDLKASGGLAQGGGTFSLGLWFWSRADSHRSVSVSIGPGRGGGSLILYLAEAETLPPRPSNSYLPGDVVRVRLHLTRPGRAALNRTFVSTGAVGSLVRAVNALVDVSAATCQGSKRLAVLTFVRQSGRSIRVTDYPACSAVKVGRTRPLKDRKGGVWDTLSRMIKTGAR